MKSQRYLDNKYLSILLFAFLFLLYAVVYMTKSMFSSAMAIIVEEGVMTKSQTGLINAAFWAVYALFQVFGGLAADKFSPFKLVIIGVAGAAISNLVIYFNQSYSVIMTAWIFNAVAQFGLWPGVFKILSTQLAPSLRRTAVFWMLFSTSLGLGLSMLTASFVGNWKYNFLISATSLFVMGLLYIILNFFLNKRMVENEDVQSSAINRGAFEKAPMLPLMFSSGLIVFLIVCFLRISVDNGIKMMTPVMLMESYSGLPAAISTRMSSVLIIFSALGVIMAGVVQRKITKNEAKAQIIFYSIAILPLIAVCFVGNIHYAWILIALSFTILMLQGAGPYSQTYVALHFENAGRIGTVSGILNATASVGNIFASYFYAKMAESMPWGTIAVIWLSSVAFCTVLCIVVLPRWTRFTEKN